MGRPRGRSHPSHVSIVADRSCSRADRPAGLGRDRTGLARPLWGVRVVLYRPGYPLVSGYTDATGSDAGCLRSGQLYPGGDYQVYVYSQAKTTAGNQLVVRDASTVSGLDSQNPVYPVGAGSVFAYAAGAVARDDHTTFTLPPSDWTRVLGIGTWALQRRSAGLTNTTINAYVNFTTTSPSMCNNSSCFQAVSRAIFGTSTKRFVIAHEVGHAVASARNGWKQTKSSYKAPPDTCDGEPHPVTGDPYEHSMSSKEYQSAAANEGFAHYYAAVAFNNTGQTDCRFRYYKLVDWNHDGTQDDTNDLDCEGGPALSAPGTGTMSNGDYLDEECAAGGTTNRGTQYDWLRFFWDLDTNSSTGSTIHTTQIADIWDEANPHSWRPTDAGLAKRPWPRIRDACSTLGHSCNSTATFNGVDQ